MTAESGGTTVLGKQVSDLQSGVTVGTSAITGTLIKNAGWESGPLEGEGYFMALKFTASNWNAYDSVRVGLNPSQGTGLVDILSDPDKNGVFKITNKDTQKFVIEARKGATTIRKEWSLSGLTLAEPEPPVVEVSAIFEGGVCSNQSSYNLEDSETPVSITQNLEIEDDSTLATGEYTGTISGTTNGNYIHLSLKDTVVPYFNSLTAPDFEFDGITISIRGSASNETVFSTSGWFAPDSSNLDHLAIPIKGSEEDPETGEPGPEVQADEITITLEAEYISGEEETGLQDIVMTYMVGGITINS